MKRDISIMIYIIVLPFLFYLYTLAPVDSKSWKTFFFTFNSGYFETIDLYFWTLSIKCLTIGLLSVWYVTCLQRWRNVIILPILVEFHKLLINLKYSITGSQDVELLNTFLVSFPYVLILILLRKKLKYSSNQYKINKVLNEEINNQLITLSKFKAIDYKFTKKEFDKLKSQKINMDKKEYLVQLIKLRDQMAK